jgi:hypothetical protein
MTDEPQPPMDPRTQAALRELQRMLREHYPAATFQVRRGTDDPASIHLVSTVDVEDTDTVLDVVIDRVMELQVEEGLPIHVIPLRPIARVLALRQKAKQVAQRFQTPLSP